MKACSSVQELQRLVQQHGQQLAAADLAAAFNLLPKLQGHRSSKLQLLEQLWQLLQPKLLQCDQKGLCHILWASSKLQYEHAQLYSRCFELYLKGMARAIPRQHSIVVYALCTAPSAVRQQHQTAVMQQLVPAFMQQLGGANAQDIANVLYSIAGSGQQLEAKQVQQLVGQFVAALATAKPQNVSNTLWAVATMGKQVQPRQLQQLLDAFAGMLHQAKPQDVANTLWAVATTEQQVQQCQLQQLLGAFAGMLQQAKPLDVSHTLWAVATMGQQVQARQLQQLLTAFAGMLQQAKPLDVSHTLWAVATMGGKLQPRQLQQLLDAFTIMQQAKPQNVSNTLWAVATMEQQVQPQQLQQLLAAFVGMLQQAAPQNVSNTLWACGKLGFLPDSLLAAPQLGSMLLAAKAQELANVAWACGELGYRDEQLVAALLQETIQRLAADSCSFTTQGLCNVCWSIAVLDLQQHADQVLRLVQACSQQWSSMCEENLQQLWQVQIWLQDFQLAGSQGLAGTLTQEQLQQCKAAWEAELDATATSARISELQTSVFAAVQQLCIDWDQPPQMEQRSVGRDGVTDGALLIDITAETASGVLLAIEVDGPSHFRQPDGGLMGTTQYRNRALAVRGYTVISIPWFNWSRLKGDTQRQQQRQYLLEQLAAAGVV